MNAVSERTETGKKLISFCIPCYHSEKTLPAVVEEIDTAMEELPA